MCILHACCGSLSLHNVRISDMMKKARDSDAEGIAPGK